MMEVRVIPPTQPLQRTCRPLEGFASGGRLAGLDLPPQRPPALARVIQDG
jgi:hypothetical protein